MLARLFAAALFLAMAPPAVADDIEVDLELFLAVDVSRSMSPRELEIQRRGYAEALASDEVINAIERGLLGQIALTYVEWAEIGPKRIIVDWTLIDGREAAETFASKLTAQFNDALRRTSISDVLDYAAHSFTENGFESWRTVIDVSGDGPNNMGLPVDRVRDRVLKDGVVINGLPLMTKEGLGMQWHLDDLDKYYEACVIGGPGSFVIPVLEWEEFPAAVRRKLVLEIAGDTPKVVPAQFAEPVDYDCLIGEKIFEEFMRYWREL
ncbi:MAG: DUF1194 domain-containing protein [Pseudomonadota bacterium]